MDFRKNDLARYTIVIGALVVVFLAVIGKEIFLMFGEKAKWTNYFNSTFVHTNIVIPARRGNILSADGQLMASSIPEYKIYMDFQAGNDTVFMEKLDSITEGLARIFPDQTPSSFRKRLLEGRKKRSRYWLIYPHRITYTQFNETKKLPFFNLGRNKSGLSGEVFNQREKPFGSLASRTLGSLYPAKDSARNGLELAYDSILRGKDGRAHREKVLNSYQNVLDQPPVDGADIVTTIDVDMQDICEQALLKEMKMPDVNAQMGVVILMDVKTGDVKAIVNMTKCPDGQYREVRNDAVSMMMEPGSVFKTASFLVAFDDGYLHMGDHVDTGNGIWRVSGQDMKDWNWHRGGYGVISVPECLMYSSNVGVSKFIDKFYHDQPEKYVDGLYRVGIADDLHLPIPGAAHPWVRHPKADRSNWSNTALPWMSIGYETQVPPINTITFYNAIANGGKMVKPRFVKCSVKNGEVVQEFPVEVLKEKIASDEALDNIRAILKMVVNDPKGLGKKAGNKQFHVSGKTGTAQVSQGRSGYKSGGISYLLSFCGYFPSEDPKYTCIVCLRKSGLPASGGLMAGSVFGEIAERVYARNIYKDVSYACDSVIQVYPDVLHGDVQAAHYVLDQLEISNEKNWTGSSIFGIPVWGTASRQADFIALRREPVYQNRVPNVVGMGARDAVFLLESRGLKVSLEGVGKVVAQSIPANSNLVKGQRCHLVMQWGCEVQKEQKKGTDNKEQNTERNETERSTQKDSAKTNNRRG